MFKYSLLVLCINLSFNYDLECTDAGSCSITFTNQQKLAIGPGIIPINPEKFIVPFKVGTVSSDPPSAVNIAQYNELEMLNKYLDGSSFQCADGLGECINACCYKGKCVDPSNVCREFSSLSHMIIILVIIAFGFLIIIYWIAYYYIGVRHNTANPHDDKELYLRRTEIPANNNQREVVEEVPANYNPWQKKEDEEVKMETPNNHINLNSA
jgi:hypothetical protein